MTRDNPQTSVDAAEDALRGAASTRARILAIVRLHEPVTSDELVQHYHRYRGLFGWPPVSDSGIRSRASELQDDKLLARMQATYGVSRYGRPAMLWRAVGV